MKTEYDIIIQPVINEKTNLLMDKNNQYTFKVFRDANKIQIKKAVELMFNVKVKDVKTTMVRGKKRRVRYKQGKQPDWKKAIVTLPENESINLFEGV